MKSTLIGILLLGSLIVIFVLSWVLNHHTKVPESCRANQKECVGCSFKGCPSFTPIEPKKEEIVKTIDMDRDALEELKKNTK